MLRLLALACVCYVGIDARTWADEPAAGAVGETAPAKRSAWSYAVTPDALVKIFYRGLPIVESRYLYWGKEWSWAGPQMRVESVGEGNYVISGKSDGLGLKFGGTVELAADGKLVLSYIIDASRDVPEAIGGGLEWSLKTDLEILNPKPSDPELVADSKGWKWAIGGGDTIMVEADAPLAGDFFERNQKNTVRTYFHASQVPKGRRIVRLTISLPEGAERKLSDDERYGEAKISRWYRDALRWDASPVDLRFLNRQERPAGRRGFLKAEGDQLVFEDGTKGRFWGGNLAAYALFSTPRKNVATQAKRMAQLGYNLMRIHHHDSEWVTPNVFLNGKVNTRVLDPKSLDSLDWWIKCLEDEGIYVWLDMRVGRISRPADSLSMGIEDITKGKGSLATLDYLNPEIQGLMKEFQAQYLSHVNSYTRKAYKDDPGVMAVLITNEDDLTTHGGNAFLPNNGLKTHHEIWDKDYISFASEHNLPKGEVFKTWVPGPSKLHLNDLEHRFNLPMIASLRELGLRAPIATTNFWGNSSMFALGSLTDGDVIDIHSYGESDAFECNPHYSSNYIDWIGAGQIHGKPLTISEWNVPNPRLDRFTAPLYVASIADLQGWDAPMVYNYSQSGLQAPTGTDEWSTAFDLAITGMMPAAALAYRRGHVSPARKNYCLMPGKDLFYKHLNPVTSVAIRTLVEQSKLTIGMPAMEELPWLKPTNPTDSVVVTDYQHDYIPEGQSFVKSDTGELTRDWEQGTQIIDSERTQSVSGWIGGRALATRDASFSFSTRKAVVALSSVDDLPIASSRFILISAMARVFASAGGKPPFLSEPVKGQITIRSKVPDLTLLALGGDGHVVGRSKPKLEGEAIRIDLPAAAGTHWFVLKVESHQGAPTTAPK